MTLESLNEAGKSELLTHLGSSEISSAKIEDLRALIISSGSVEKVEALIEKLTTESLSAIEDPAIAEQARPFLTYIAQSAVKRSA
jgi:geranylgeranyl diphosphate synthase type I